MNAGEDLRFDALVRPHRSTMRRVAAALGAPADPDDIVQESLLAAWQQRQSYDPARGSVLTWLLGITARQARRAGSRRGRLTALLAGEPTELPGTDPDSYADARQRLDLRQAIARLPRRQAEVTVLHYYADLRISDIADVLGCSEGTVKSTLSDARRRLATRLGVDYAES